MTLEDALRNLVVEARSEDGVTRRGVDAALAARDRAQVLLGALNRILGELDDDGITEGALEDADRVLQQAGA
jgi:hypothetical protein